MTMDRVIQRTVRKDILQLKARQHRLALVASGRELGRPVELMSKLLSPQPQAAGSVGWLGMLLQHLRNPLLRGVIGLLMVYWRQRRRTQSETADSPPSATGS
ncbi:hypothetical protein [Chitinilyticum piscinae]|uniref:Uncharacterized protein n=1 Tax=Chitinilyticum piscinae TaxID=2866724 RepID=A0A8J7FKH1_9NEIS|nr:hypothetical protein [Chitinilyticum piscinae]MBE9607726.1 hypothetical protein [Chitinilyticum piscinae]